MTTGVFAGLSEPDHFLLKQYEDDDRRRPGLRRRQEAPDHLDRQGQPVRHQPRGEVTGELITSDKPDIVFGGMTPVVCTPVGSQCEANGVPCVTYGCPMEPGSIGMGGNPADPTKGFNWAYNVFFSVGGDLNPVYVGLLNLFQTNKKVACCWPNDPDGIATADTKTGMPPALEAAGYTVVNPGLFTQGTEDFSSIINKFKADGCECLVGHLEPAGLRELLEAVRTAGLQPQSDRHRPGHPGAARHGRRRRHRQRSLPRGLVGEDLALHVSRHGSHLPGHRRCLGRRRTRANPTPRLWA